MEQMVGNIKFGSVVLGLALGCGISFLAYSIGQADRSDVTGKDGIVDTAVDPSSSDAHRAKLEPLSEPLQEMREASHPAADAQGTEVGSGEKGADPRLGRHLWSDAELGLDLGGAWDGIEMNDYMFNWDSVSPTLSLTAKQATARRGRLLELWYSDEAYWASRSNELVLLGAIRVLRDPNSTTAKIRSRVGMGLMIAKYWILNQAGLTQDLENGESVPQRIQEGGFDITGTIGIGNIYAGFGYIKGDFPVFDEWAQFELALASEEAVNLRNKSSINQAGGIHPAHAPETKLSYSLRSHVLDALEIAIVLQQSVTPLPLPKRNQK